jgi:ABC-type multidrug transport system fused ATPase/permease subunit
VVLVGANGSGKSTIIKLLNRLYDVDAGEILVDGLDIKSYKISDLRRAQAVLTQGHQMYSMLTLAENIGLGNTEHVDDTEMIMQAAEDGGAAGVIHKLVDGVQTVLHPDTVVYSGQLDQHKHRKLRSILEQLERRPAALSGTRPLAADWLPH